MNRRAIPQLLVPSSVNIPHLLQQHGKTTREVETHQDKYHYILNRIMTGSRYFESEDQEYVNIRMEALEAALGKKYAKPTLDDLVAWGIIQTDNHYLPQSKSRGYKLHPTHETRGVYLMVYGETMERKLTREYLVHDLKNRKTRDKARCIEWKNIKRLTIRKKEAVAYLDGKLAEGQACLHHFGENLAKVRKAQDFKAWKKEKEGEGNEMFPLMFPVLVKIVSKGKGFKWATLVGDLKRALTNRYNADLASINNIASGRPFLERPDPKSRIYTNLTSISADLRPFLHLKKSSQPLVNLDIRNSQPYLFGLLLRANYQGKEMPDDVRQYIDLTSKGTFYEFMMDKLEIPLEGRGEFKVQFFAQLFFCKEAHSKATEPGKAFQALFPNVLGVINQYKEAGRRAGKDSKGRDQETRLLPLAMQRQEAELIHQVIGLTLAGEGIWYSTIHDSLAVLQEHAERVRELIEEAFTKAMGIPPSIKEERWTMD